MSSVDNGEEEDTPSKPGTIRLSFIKDPSRIEALLVGGRFFDPTKNRK